MKNLGSALPVHAVTVAPRIGIEAEASSDDFIAQVTGLRRFLLSRALFLTQGRGSAEDLVQDTLERALVARVNFQQGTNLKAWLGMILRNLFIDCRRHDMARARLDQAYQVEPAEEERDPCDILSLKDVTEALGKLSATDREIFQLFFLERLAYRTISERLAIPVVTVGTRLLRSKRRLRAVLARVSEARLALAN
ncbi:MAG TPA: RNA polymerase sigma factor [Polyangia bacterium]|jgi:RNA polymerase sigma-70 factor (ECF subfamily)